MQNESVNFDSYHIITILQIMLLWLWYCDVEYIANQPWYVICSPMIASLIYFGFAIIGILIGLIISFIVSLFVKR